MQLALERLPYGQGFVDSGVFRDEGRWGGRGVGEEGGVYAVFVVVIVMVVDSGRFWVG